MNVHLLQPDRDFAMSRAPNLFDEAVVRDLDLGPVFLAMAGKDDRIRSVVRSVLLSVPTDPETVRFRQAVFADCLSHAPVVGELRALAQAALADEREVWGFGEYPESVLYRGTKLLTLLLPRLRRLRALAGAEGRTFRSAGFRRFFDGLSNDLDDAFFRSVEDLLRLLRFSQGTLLSARLGIGNHGADYTLRRPVEARRRWLRMPFRSRRSPFTFELGDRDESGRQALADLRGRGLAQGARALRQSTARLHGFFTQLRDELDFYLAGVILRDRLARAGLPVCVPDATAASPFELASEGLYDVSLALDGRTRVIPNDLRATGRPLIVITGANQGGKSTLLRAIGVSVLLTQSGLAVPARNFVGSVPTGIFTHFRREEDPTMKFGKFEEELDRMSAIARNVRPGGLVLANESFASTNEREGSEIAEAVLRAFLDGGVRVVLVTHFYDLASRLERSESGRALFLRADRSAQGERTFRIVPGPPQPTGFGGDLYRRVFGTDPAAVTA